MKKLTRWLLSGNVSGWIACWWLTLFPCPAFLAFSYATAAQEISGGQQVETFDTLVICPVEFQPALSRWLEYRREQGYLIRVVTPDPCPAQLQAQVRSLAEQAGRSGGELRYLFLIGGVNDKIPIAGGNQKNRGDSEAELLISAVASGIPMHYLPAQVNQLFGSEETIDSDTPYADLNGDGLPDLALGRFPCSSLEEVQDYLDRVIAYETTAGQPLDWRRRINIIAGVGGFGEVIDNLLEQVTRTILTDLIPQEYQTSMTLASWRSPFCPDPRRFDQTTVEKMNEGCLFWVYIGHGHPTQLDQVRLPDRLLPIMNREIAQQVACPQGNPIAVFLACYTAAIDHLETCLTETLLTRPNGPIATLAGTRVTMPYAMSLLSLELIDGYFHQPLENLGDLILFAKRQMIAHHPPRAAPGNGPLPQSAASAESAESAESSIDAVRRMILATGKDLSPRPDLLLEECWEHVQMMHLFGDPLLRLQRPLSIPLNIQGELKQGSKITIQGVAPREGKLCVELTYRRDRFRFRPSIRRKYSGLDADLEEYQREYLKAQDLTCEFCLEHVTAGPFEITLEIPANAVGDCVIRCYQECSQGVEFGVGAIPVTIEKDRG